MDSSDTGCNNSYKSQNISGSASSSLNYSSDINAVSSTIELSDDHPIEDLNLNSSSCRSTAGSSKVDSGSSKDTSLKYLPKWPAVNLEFRDLVFEVPGNAGCSAPKQILKKINGSFRSHELTAIMGPSGAGKTTLLNILTGFGSCKSSGRITVNNSPRDMRIFRKMSRYIMQNDVLDPQFTVMETMMFAANLKLGNELSKEQKLEVIDEILQMLRLKNAANTLALRLSGGEKKRLCVASELVNNPPVLFLDEPTTGLDDLSSSQCIALLRRIAHGGRTIVCSIHTPSAKIFEMFDKVYILAEGECIYQGSGKYIVPYMQQVGLSCPRTYNPADFIIEVACREYGNQYHDRLVKAVQNGNVAKWTPPEDDTNKSIIGNSSDTTSGACSLDDIEQFEEEINPRALKSKCSAWQQFCLILQRMFLQIWRDQAYLKLKAYMNLALGLLVGSLYQGMGNDATKALFNFGFTLTIIIAYLYLPLMPVLLQFPSTMRLLKREYFNQWYSLRPYYAALLCAKLPFMIIMSLGYLIIIYLMSSQPLELFRFAMVYMVAFLTAITSDSFGVMIASRFSLVNGMFMGPVLAVPFILLSCFGAGYGREVYVPQFVRFIMNFSYLRHGMEGMMAALYDYNRADTVCPELELVCPFKKSKYLLEILGFPNLNYFFSLACLSAFYIFFTVAGYVLIRHRLSSNRSSPEALQYLAKFFKNYFNFTSYNY